MTHKISAPEAKNIQIRQQTLALAAIVQAAVLVDQIARTGQGEPQAIEASINSLFAFSATSAEEAYEGIENLEIGIRGLRDLLSGNDYGERKSVMRYCLGVLHLHKKLRKDTDTAASLRNRLQHTEKQKDFNGNDINMLSSSLSSIYQDTISKYNFRIQITGSAQELQNTNNAARIRTLLLAAIRAGYLWQQAGGSRWKLVLQRNRIFTETKQLLATEIRR
ncbi:High frequency lysogenization protein HflD [Zhongshania aliphaticivorans]|uniref:High frequency lysogenization protein HflD homolog n=1 Tax=Zhongshania aliphaticivorans TaxID=1470434 RepID=A0A5S9NWP7_9GAMM|nr:high frequency lysogenization protein HflD [Zhongshania aliphaticivorans]CAA0088764.1 High frequency lysogenization protein HflD [Zhongshania aliphaticivorans]CAA0095095.1 High frequency lysogenization protein HflD [Zhongshania aliphaticivorans]